jgi:hypothetical protein
MNFNTRNASKLVILVLVTSINLIAAAAIAQTAQGTPSDLQFEVINAIMKWGYRGALVNH